MRFLVAESEPLAARKARRDSVGRSSGETYADVLCAMVPDSRCDRVTPADGGTSLPSGMTLEGYDAVFLTGSPLHLYQETDETRREVGFMQAVYACGTPSFGSCAGLQLATVAAGGTVRPMRGLHEAGFARRIHPVAGAGDHPLLAGRGAVWDAPAIHADEVERLPPGARLLASNAVTTVQAAEIRHGAGTFWGVQYHPELSLAEVAAALRRQADDLVDHGLARGTADVETVAALVDELAAEPDRSDVLWRLGLDPLVANVEHRRRELRNFIDRLVRPTRAARGRD